MRAFLAILIVLVTPTLQGSDRTMTIDDVVEIRRASDLQISPDGSRVVFVVREADRDADRFTADLYVAEIESGRTSQLTFHSESDWHPRWRPGGNGIAFLSDRDGRTALYIMGDDGAELRMLFSHTSPVTQFEWRSDGKAMAFVAADPRDKPMPSRVGRSQSLLSTKNLYRAGRGSMIPRPGRHGR